MEKVSEGRAIRSKKIEEIKSTFEASNGGVLTDYRGLTVAQISDLRRKFRENNISFHVVKNTLTRIAVSDTSYKGLSEYLVGPTGIAFGEDDAITAARVAVEFAKDHEHLSVKGGFMDGIVLSANEVNEVSKLGGKKELLAQVLSVFNGPSQRFLGVLNGVPQKLLGVFKAREEQLGEES